MKTIRKTGFAGSFYPDNEEEILAYIKAFNNQLNSKKSFETKAVIVPHAGYIYSGSTANLAYNISKNKKIKRVIVIGPSHYMNYKGASIALYDKYETPLGNIMIDKVYSNYLKEKYDFLDFDENMHLEHSTETQAPFIKHYFKNASIVEIVYGKISHKDLSMLIDEIFEDEENLLVISSDLSHFYSQKKANKLDNICLNAIANKDLDLFSSGCEACGITGIKAVVRSAIKMNLDTEILHYCTSYDRTNDASSVVGYASVLVGR